MTQRYLLRLISFVFACVSLAVLAAPALHADTVVLTNGDKLTGTAIKLEAGKLTFKTAYAGAIAIAWDQVASLTTSQPLILPTPNWEDLQLGNQRQRQLHLIPTRWNAE